MFESSIEFVLGLAVSLSNYEFKRSLIIFKIFGKF